jgi:hypothetical protein
MVWLFVGRRAIVRAVVVALGGHLDGGRIVDGGKG